MSIKVLVTADAAEEVDFVDDSELLDVLSGEYDVAFQLCDLFSAVKEALAETVDQESELNIEVTAALDLKASAETKFLIFNVGGAANKTNTMTVSLKTKIKPKKRQ